MTSRPLCRAARPRAPALLAALGLLLAAGGATAQVTQPGSPQPGGGTGMRPPSQATATAYDANRMSLLPGTRSGYVGFNLGRPDYNVDCPFDCDDGDWRAQIYTGGLVNEWIGGELGYQYEGKADRAGGTTKAEGINLSLVLRAPLGAFSVYGKVGALYGRTRVSSVPLIGVPSGKDEGWGAAYALGVGYDFMPQTGIVLEWARNEYRFRGQGREAVDSTNVGLVYRF